ATLAGVRGHGGPRAACRVRGGRPLPCAIGTEPRRCAQDARRAALREPRPAGRRVLRGRDDRGAHRPARRAARARRHRPHQRRPVQEDHEDDPADRPGAGGRVHPRGDRPLGKAAPGPEPRAGHAAAHPRLGREPRLGERVRRGAGGRVRRPPGLSRAQQLGPELAETHLALGYYYYWGSRDYDRALEQFGWVRERQPNDPDVISAIGYIRRRQGRWAEAVSNLLRAAELDPRSHSLFFDLGQTYRLLRRYSEAERALGRAISLAPEVPGYYAQRADLYLMQDGNATRAGQVLQQAGNTLDPARILADPIAGEYRERVRVLAADYHDALTRLTLQAVGGDS